MKNVIKNPEGTRRLIVLFVFSLLASVIFPFIISRYVNGKMVYPVLYSASVVLNLVLFLSFFCGAIKRKIILGFLYAVYLFSGVTLILFILMIPFDAYKAWINVDIKPEGTISTIFAAASLILSVIVSGFVYRLGIIKTFVLHLFANSAVLFVLINSYGIAFASLSILFFGIIFIPERTNYFGQKFKFFFMMFISVIIASFVLSSSIKKEQGWLTSYLISENFKGFVLETFPNSKEAGAISGYGLFYRENVFANKPRFSESEIFRLSIENGEPFKEYYIKIRTYSYYGGTLWSAQSRKKSEKVSFEKYNISFGSSESYSNIKLFVSGDYLPYIPYMLSSEKIVVKSQSANSISPASEYGEYISSGPLLKNDTVSITLNPDYNKTINYGGMNHFVELLGSKLPSDELIPYLQIPENPRLKKLADSLKSKDKGAVGTVENILNYLSDEMTLSANLNLPEIDEDIVEHFIDEKKGYSVHFATAMAVLLRYCGIPSRYVEGFRISSESNKKFYLVTAFNSHSWTEIYADGIGWIRIDPLTYFFHPKAGKAAKIERDPETEKYISAMEGRLKKRKQIEYLKKKNVLIISMIAAAAALLYVIFRFIKWFMFRKKIFCLPRDKRLAKELRKLTALFSDENIFHPSLTGWNKWFNQAEKKYPDLKKLDEIRNIVLRSVYFSGNDAESVKSLRNAVRALKAEKKDKLD
ncbi:MAG TPA: transglutaminase domain-containing protein [Spirochaetota bacterium]|nr:transglutaminase domain-containing protein [Spirochaetota bacterium]HOR44977.1 transglutaminase domain-containing protein [Spirochaetota bacterium]HPK56696.1 transglutaminase domain-containing protein [Spirochaetota bacterium]